MKCDNEACRRNATSLRQLSRQLAEAEAILAKQKIGLHGKQVMAYFNKYHTKSPSNLSFTGSARNDQSY